MGFFMNIDKLILKLTWKKITMKNEEQIWRTHAV
jgi:hypothetical protein